MIQIAICDDDAGELEKAGALLETYCGLHRDADMVCRRFSSGAELLAFCLQVRFLYLLFEIFVDDLVCLIRIICYTVYNIISVLFYDRLVKTSGFGWLVICI